MDAVPGIKYYPEKRIKWSKTKIVKKNIWILEVPNSTPLSVVKYEFGIIDTDLDCLVEKVVLACNTINKQGLREKLWWRKCSWILYGVEGSNDNIRGRWKIWIVEGTGKRN